MGISTPDSEGAVAVTRLSVRYHELLAFIIAAFRIEILSKY